MRNSIDAVRNQEEEKEVLATLETLIQAYMTKDLAAVARIYHDNLSHGHSSGQLDTKDDAIRDVQNRFWKIKYTATVRVTGPMAVVRAVMDFRVGTTPEMTTHKPDMRVLWVFLKGEQGWQVIAYQAVRPTV